MDTRTIELNLKKLRSHQTAKPFKFLFPHKNVQKESNQLVSALAHEVRNPLATINLAVQILKSPNRVLDHKVYLDIILKASGQINDLITDLLTSWQPGERQLEKCTIHQLLDEALAMRAGVSLFRAANDDGPVTECLARVLISSLTTAKTTVSVQKWPRMSGQSRRALR